MIILLQLWSLSFMSQQEKIHYRDTEKMGSEMDQNADKKPSRAKGAE